MILFVIYSFAGIYILLMSMGFIHRSFLNKKDPFSRSNIRMSMALFGMGLLVLGLYYGYVYGIAKPILDEHQRSSIQLDKKNN